MSGESTQHRQSLTGLRCIVSPVSGSAVRSVDEPEPFRSFGLGTIVLTNVLMIGHFTLGAMAIIVNYSHVPVLACFVALAYFLFATLTMYVLVPDTICPGCVYRARSGGRCPTGLNVLSRRLNADRTHIEQFGRRATGAFCDSNLYLTSLGLPLVVAMPGLVLWFSLLGLGLAIGLVGLLAIQLLVVMRHVTCPHCLARRWCPTAHRMGLA